MFRSLYPFLFCLTLSQAAHAISPEPVYGREGMVASRSMLASQAGRDILRAGGNAVDAAVATAFALAVTHPAAGNLGGGGFAVVRLANGEVVTLDHRETAPAAATEDMYLDEQGEVIDGLSTASHLASGVPGSVHGLTVLLEAHGTLPLREVIQPAIRMAERGIVLSHDLARSIKRQLPRMEKYPGSMKKFSKNGEPYEAGEIWRQPDLAKTLKRIRDRGRDGFYRGPVAGMIAREMQRGGGIITRADLANYRSKWRAPIHGRYRGHDIYSMAPPSSGGVMLVQMLNMLEPYDLAAMGWGSAAYAHHLIEAERRAYADRAEYLGDPDYYEVPVARLTDPEYAADRYADFDPDKASRSEDTGAGTWPAESRETTHFSVMDKAGNMVAFTTTLNSGYGNRIVAEGTGVLLNNEMDDFSVKPNTLNQFGLIGREANAIVPGKRMLSSMTPSLVLHRGRPLLITGSPGGSTIITTTLQVILNVVEHQMPLDEAVGLPRFHHQWIPNRIVYGRHRFSPETRQKLEAMGHVNFTPVPWGRGIGDANSILLMNDGVMAGMSDPRNDGGAAAY